MDRAPGSFDPLCLLVRVAILATTRPVVSSVLHRVLVSQYRFRQSTLAAVARLMIRGALTCADGS